MIKVNLLPSENRKFNFAAYIQDFFGYIMVLFCLVVFGNVLLMSVGTKKVFEVQSVQKKWTEREPKAQEIAVLRKEVTDLRNKSNAFKQNVFPVVSFSQIMYLVYENLPLNLWLSSLEFKDDKLRLNGSALDFDADASLSIKEYMEALKNSQLKDFFDGDIKIDGLERSRIGDKSVVRYSLELNKKASDEK